MDAARRMLFSGVVSCDNARQVGFHMSHTVLLIDGEPLTEHLFSRALRLAGHSVMLASDTAEALENLDGDLPDAIVILTNDLESAEDSRALRTLVGCVRFRPTSS